LRRWVERRAPHRIARTATSRRPKRAHGGLPSEQNARLRAGIKKETEGVTLVSTRHSAPQFPLHLYTILQRLGDMRQILQDAFGSLVLPIDTTDTLA